MFNLFNLAAERIVSLVHFWIRNFEMKSAQKYSSAYVEKGKQVLDY